MLDNSYSECGIGERFSDKLVYFQLKKVTLLPKNVLFRTAVSGFVASASEKMSRVCKALCHIH